MSLDDYFTVELSYVLKAHKSGYLLCYCSRYFVSLKFPPSGNLMAPSCPAEIVSLPTAFCSHVSMEFLLKEGSFSILTILILWCNTSNKAVWLFFRICTSPCPYLCAYFIMMPCHLKWISLHECIIELHYPVANSVFSSRFIVPLCHKKDTRNDILDASVPWFLFLLSQLAYDYRWQKIKVPSPLSSLTVMSHLCKKGTYQATSTGHSFPFLCTSWEWIKGLGANL